jgi:tetratricopeptide (TPR) repeat protein
VPADRYQDFVFNPADLSEDVDLDLDRRREILYVHAHLKGWTHWKVLGLAWNASPDEVRDAYRERVKVFHPDRYPGKRLGSYRARLEQVFRRLTEARDELASEAGRAAYVARTAPADEFARMEARRLEDEQRTVERRARLARSNPLVARAARVAELVQRGKQQLAEGRFPQAMNDFLTASSLDASNAEARSLAQEARKRASGERARELWDRSQAAALADRLELAQELAAGAAEADPQNPRYAVFAARLALRRGAFESARDLAAGAVKVQPSFAPAHEVLGEALAEQGDKGAARRELERALELDPTLESARERLKKMRWSFLG